MNYIVFDLEWNQDMNDEIVNDVKFEIIEIAAIKLNDELEITGEFKEIIRPVIYKKLHPIIKELTGFKENELRKGITFPECITKFMNWIGTDEYRFCTWATQDLYELQKNMNHYGMYLVEKPPLYYYDIQKLFSIMCENGKDRRALKYAVDLLNIEKKVPFHRAYGDAYYTAMVMKKIEFEKVKSNFSIDIYRIPYNREEEIYVRFDRYDKFISMGYENREKLMAQRYLRRMYCNLCDRKIRTKIDWFSDGMRSFYYLGKCRKHGFVKGKIRIRKNCSNKVFAIKTIKNIGVDEMEEIKQKKFNKKTSPN